ncbi:MAG: spore coat protein [Lachnospiraceae bacterium]|nr:spore coat protein [Lachnospiraceae bacterium]MDE6624834.1 spore coat protein [Lachnospiraceae bacterium]
MELYQEKEILGDALAAQKAATNLFNTFSNECVHEGLRSTMLDILADEHSMQQDVFCSMHERGFYPTPDAEQRKIDETKQKYLCSYKPL